jgi:membrane-bound serine protease (ClpP class)
MNQDSSGIRIMFRLFRLLPLVVVLAAVAVVSDATAKTPTIDVLHVKGTVNPVLADYVERGIKHAGDTGAVACIIQIDTPGGLDTAMRDIVQDILDSDVPVVVYVSPSGSRAASAGAFITLAAHIAAMAPNTTIGAAHPVSISSEGEMSAVDEKVVNDAAAYIRTLAETHGRNAEWAEKAVRESVSATEKEALDLGVIEIIASDLDSLINQLNDRRVTLLNGQEVTLDTRGTTPGDVNMDFGENFLYIISDPNIAYILLSLATLGLIVEISSPGLVFPGVVGGICLLLAFYSLGLLPVNYAGVLLIILAFGLFIAEVFTASFGVLLAGGIVSLVLGSLILFKGGPLFRVNPWLIAIVVIIIAGFFVFAIQRVISAHRRQATTGREDLAGKSAVVKKALQPEGMVLFRGELWSAVSESGPVDAGEEVTINRVEGLKLYVSKK